MPEPRSFSIALVQMSCTADPDENLARALQMIEKAATAGAEIICLQELYRSLYFCQVEDPQFCDLAEPVPGPTTMAISKIAGRLGVVVVAPLFERRAAGLYHNSAAVLDADGKLLGLYRKMHIPDDPGYYEKYYFTPGDLGFRTFDTKKGRIAVLICWDQWYPEGARLAALGGAEVLFYPTAIGWHSHEKEQQGRVQREAWQTVQRGHAIANGVYVAAANRVGHEVLPGAGIQFWGSSFIVDPQGVLVAQASEDREEVLLGRIDLERIEDVRRNWPFLRDRRVDAYKGIARRYLDGESG